MEPVSGRLGSGIDSTKPVTMSSSSPFSHVTRVPEGVPSETMRSCSVRAWAVRAR